MRSDEGKVARPSRSVASLSPERSRDEDQQRNDLESSQDHRERAHPALKIGETCVVARRSDAAQSRAHVVDAGEDGAERSGEVQPGQQERESQGYDAEKVQEREAEYCSRQAVGHRPAADPQRQNCARMHELLHLICGLSSDHEGTNHFYVPAGLTMNSPRGPVPRALVLQFRTD
jgi:hypothetical protein